MKKRIIAILTAASVTFAPTVSVLANSKPTLTKERQYVIVTEDKEVLQKLILLSKNGVNTVL